MTEGRQKLWVRLALICIITCEVGGSCIKYGHSCLGGHGKRGSNGIFHEIGDLKKIISQHLRNDLTSFKYPGFNSISRASLDDPFSSGINKHDSPSEYNFASPSSEYHVYPKDYHLLNVRYTEDGGPDDRFEAAASRLHDLISAARYNN